MSTPIFDPIYGTKPATQMQVLQMGAAAKANTEAAVGTSVSDAARAQADAASAQQIAQAAKAKADAALIAPVKPTSTQVVVLNPDGSVETRPMPTGTGGGSTDPSITSVTPPAV